MGNISILKFKCKGLKLHDAKWEEKLVSDRQTRVLHHKNITKASNESPLDPLFNTKVTLQE